MNNNFAMNHESKLAGRLCRSAVVCLSGALAPVCGLSADAPCVWDPGEPVTTYWSGPGCSGKNHPPLTEKWLDLLKEGGFNTVWATTPEELDLAGKYGMRVIYALKPDSMRPKFDLDDPEQVAYLTAAYGAQGLYYYVFCRVNHTGAMCEPGGTINPDGKFAEVSKLNRAFVAIARELRPLTFRGAFMQGRHAPGTTPYCAQALLKLSPETPHSELDTAKMDELDDTTLVTRFDDLAGRPSHLMVVNCDYRKDRTLHIDAPAPLERFDDATGVWTPVGTSFDQPFVRGGGILFRFAR